MGEERWPLLFPAYLFLPGGLTMRCFVLGVTLLFLTLALLALSPALQAQDKKNAFLDPEKAGPDFLVQGEYEGQIAGKDKLGAQVVAKGNGKFSGFFFPGGLPGAGSDDKTKLKLDA